MTVSAQQLERERDLTGMVLEEQLAWERPRPGSLDEYTIAVDFDGVIHSYTTPWISPEVIPDPPVEGAIAWLAEMLEHFSVCIHTTRARTPEGVAAVRAWLKAHAPKDRPDMQLFETYFRITSEKPAALIYLDDRAYRFEGPGTFPTRDQIHRARPWNKRIA